MSCPEQSRLRQGQNKTSGIISGTLFAIFLVSCLGPEAVGSAAESFAFRPGVIVDPGRQVIYLMNLQGGIDALKVDSGKLIWSTSRAAKPLLLTGELLVAQAEDPDRPRILRIVTLDLASGSVMKEAEIELPEGVGTSVDAGLGTTFEAEALVQKAEVIVSWTFTRRYIGGMQPGPEEAVPKTEKGAARLDLETGQLEPWPLDRIAESIDSTLPPLIAKLVSTQELPQAPWRVGEVYAWAEPQGLGRDRHVVLKRWAADTGRSLPEVTLSGNELTMRYPSADHRHLLASKLTGVTKNREIDYEWNLYSLETGERTAQVIRHQPGAWFFIAGTALIHETQAHDRPVEDGWVREPLSLRTTDLRSSRELWTHPFRDTAYRGGYPPRGGGSVDPPPGQ